MNKGNSWFTVEENEKISKLQQENTMNGQHFNLLTFSDSITKLIRSASIMRCKYGT